MMRPDRRCPGGQTKTPREGLSVTQRNIIYIVGAIVLIIVIAYFLGFFGT